MSVGCSSTSSNGVPQAYSATGTNSYINPMPGPNPTPNPTPTSTGLNTVTFVPVSLQEFNSYVATHPLNNPTDFKITIDLANVSSSGRYAGTVKLSYKDTGYQYNGTFSAGSGRNVTMSGLSNNNTLEAEFNRWYTSGGKTFFSGVFQDAYGAIILVIDNGNSGNQGDGQGGAGSLSGTVYYKNFAQSYAAQSPYRKCWFITDGPYACQSSYVNGSYQGDGGFKKLGPFSGLDKAVAFKKYKQVKFIN